MKAAFYCEEIIGKTKQKESDLSLVRRENSTNLGRFCNGIDLIIVESFLLFRFFGYAWGFKSNPEKACPYYAEKYFSLYFPESGESAQSTHIYLGEKYLRTCRTS
jgi:hypothetical protein